MSIISLQKGYCKKKKNTPRTKHFPPRQVPKELVPKTSSWLSFPPPLAQHDALEMFHLVAQLCLSISTQGAMKMLS